MVDLSILPLESVGRIPPLPTGRTSSKPMTAVLALVLRERLNGIYIYIYVYVCIYIYIRFGPQGDGIGLAHGALRWSKARRREHQLMRVHADTIRGHLIKFGKRKTSHSGKARNTQVHEGYLYIYICVYIYTYIHTIPYHTMPYHTIP